jgi:hypothetical protein
MSQENTPHPQPQPEPEPSLSPFRFRAAYVKTAVARAALQPDDFWGITVDMNLAVNTVLVAHPRIQQLRDEIATLPTDLAQIDELETYARATGHAQVLYRFAVAPPERLESIYQGAIVKRATLKADVAALTVHGLLGKEALGQLTNDVGYHNVGYDVMGMVSLLRAAGNTIAGRCATLPEDLDAAELAATELLEMAAAREKRLGGESAAETRQRAFSLMAYAYDQARRAVAYLRWEYGDSDLITPALYGSKATRKREAAPQPGSSVTVPVSVVTPSPTAGAAGVAQPSAAVPGAMGGSPYV